MRKMIDKVGEREYFNRDYIDLGIIPLFRRNYFKTKSNLFAVSLIVKAKKIKEVAEK